MNTSKNKVTAEAPKPDPFSHPQQAKARQLHFDRCHFQDDRNRFLRKGNHNIEKLTRRWTLWPPIRSALSRQAKNVASAAPNTVLNSFSGIIASELISSHGSMYVSCSWPIAGNRSQISIIGELSPFGRSGFHAASGRALKEG